MGKLLYLWSLPWGLLGLLTELLFHCLGWVHWQDGRYLATQGPLTRWMVRHSWNATTIGWSVFYWAPPTVRITIHETRHVDQCLKFGLLFLPAYWVCTLVYGYQQNPFEVDARKYTDKVLGAP